VYSVLAAGVAYNSAITVVITDAAQVQVYSGTAQTYSTSILSSRFPISITVTPAANYQVSTTTGIADASNVQIILSPIMNVIMYNVTANNLAYSGSLTVLLKDVNSNTVYSGNAATWSSTLSVLSFPLSITVTPNVTYQVFTQTGITSMTNL
jgi:hypothetical protein